MRMMTMRTRVMMTKTMKTTTTIGVAAGMMKTMMIMIAAVAAEVADPGEDLVVCPARRYGE